MTTDLKSKTVEELIEQSLYTRFAAQELACRLEEAQQQLELYAAEMSAAREAGFYSAQELWSAYQTVQQRNSAHDAKIAALAKAEALEEAVARITKEVTGPDGEVRFDSGFVKSYLLMLAAEYREAGRKE